MIFNIKKSLILTAIVLVVHSGALLLMVVLPIPPGIKIGLAALIGVSFWWQGRYGMRATMCEMRLEDDGTCSRVANGEPRHYRIVRATAHAGFVRLVLLRANERKRVQLVPQDAVEPEVYRTLHTRIAQRRLPVRVHTPA